MDGYGCGVPSTSKFKEVKLSAKGKLACRLVSAKFSESKQVPPHADHHAPHGRVTVILRVWTHRHLYNLYYPNLSYSENHEALCPNYDPNRCHKFD